MSATMVFASQDEMDRNARKWLAILIPTILGLSTVGIIALYSYQVMERWLGR